MSFDYEKSICKTNSTSKPQKKTPTSKELTFYGKLKSPSIKIRRPHKTDPQLGRYSPGPNFLRRFIRSLPSCHYDHVATSPPAIGLGPHPGHACLHRTSLGLIIDLPCRPLRALTASPSHVRQPQTASPPLCIISATWISSPSIAASTVKLQIHFQISTQSCRTMPTIFIVVQRGRGSRGWPD